MGKTLVGGRTVVFHADNLAAVDTSEIYTKGVLFMPDSEQDVVGIALQDYRTAVADGDTPSAYAQTLASQPAGIFCPVVFAQITTGTGLITRLTSEYKR